jgi:hypothetical protein
MPKPVWDDFSSSYREHVLGKKEVRNRCLVCNKFVDLPGECPYCKGIYCEEHGRPELHNCKGLSARGWAAYKALKMGEKTTLPQDIIVPNYKRPNLFGKRIVDTPKGVKKRHSIKKIFVGSILIVFCIFVYFTYMEFLDQKININNVIVEPKTVFSGDTVNIHVNISKSPSILGGLVNFLNNLVGYSEHFEVCVDGKMMLKEVVDIGFNESKIYVYPVTKKEPGMYTVSVSDLSDVFNVLWVPRFEGYNITITPNDPRAGEGIEVKIFLRNVGGINYTQFLTCSIDGGIFKSENVFLKPGESKQVCFLVGGRGTGNYNFSFNWETGKRSLVVKVVKPYIDAVTGKYDLWIDGVQHHYYLGLIKTPDGVISNSYGNFIVLINNGDYKNPTYSQLLDFLRLDKTDQYSYQYIIPFPGSYYGSAESNVKLDLMEEIINGTKQLSPPRICSDFAETLHNNAERAGIRCAFISINVGGSGHALNAFNTTDRGLVFIDDTGKLGSFGPSNCDKIVDILKVGGSYIPKSLFPEPGWSSTWDNVGIVTSIYMTWDGEWGN